MNLPRGCLPALLLLLSTLSADGQQPHVVFVTGDDEYRSEYSMPKIAEILEAKHGMRTSVAFARPHPQSNENIEGLDAVANADLAVFYLRWRKLPDPQLRKILDYTGSGKPLVGLRTTTHSFNYPEAHKHQHWNDDFGIDIFGQKWLTHHGHLSTTNVSISPQKDDHPILRGVAPSFRVRSWLYVVNPLRGRPAPLLVGHTVNPRRGLDRGPQPVAWTKTYKGARVFFTTLGHPEDFRVESVRRLLINGIYWALGKDVPAAGAEADFQSAYNPPPAGVPKDWKKQ